MFAKSHDYFVKEQIVDEELFKYIEKDIYIDNPLHDICRLALVKYMSAKDELSNKQCDICRDIIFDMCKKEKYFNFYKKYEKYFSLPMIMQDKTIVEYRTNPKNRVMIHYVLGQDAAVGHNYISKEMADVCNGVFVMEFVIFYGEEIQYYITEEYQGEQTITESAGLTLDDEDAIKEEGRESRYSMLNDIMMAYEMKENSTLSEMSAEYMLKAKLGQMVFKVK